MDMQICLETEGSYSYPSGLTKLWLCVVFEQNELSWYEQQESTNTPCPKLDYQSSSHPYNLVI